MVAMRQAQARKRCDTMTGPAAASAASMGPTSAPVAEHAFPSTTAAPVAVHALPSATAAHVAVHALPSTTAAPAAVHALPSATAAHVAVHALPSATAATAPRRGPLNATHLTSSEVAAQESTSALRTRWSLVYGRKANSYNVKYLRKAVVAPGVDVGPKRHNAAKPREMMTAIAAGDDAGQTGDVSELDGDGSAYSSDGSEVYSVVDSETAGEEWIMPPEEEGDLCMVSRRAAVSESSEGGEEEEADSSGADSDDARELQALVDRQRAGRKAKRQRRSGGLA